MATVVCKEMLLVHPLELSRRSFVELGTGTGKGLLSDVEGTSPSVPEDGIVMREVVEWALYFGVQVLVGLGSAEEALA